MPIFIIIFFITSSKFCNPFQLSKNSMNAIMGSLHFSEGVSQDAFAE
jgi:hypothetical protein